MWISGYSPHPIVIFERHDEQVKTIVTVKETTELQSTENVTVGGHTVLFLKTPENCELYWDDQRVGFEIVVEYICELFTSVPSLFVVDPPLLWILTISNTRLPAVSVSSDMTKEPLFEYLPLSEEECVYLLKSFNSSFLSLSTTFPEDFSYTGSFGIHESVNINDGSWITIDNLISIGETCTTIYLRKTKFTSTDFNLLMKSWFNHKVNALRFLVVEADNFGTDAIFAGFEDELITVEGTMVCENYFGQTFEFPDDIKVLRRDDGMIATAALHSIGPCISIWPNVDSVRADEKGWYKLLPIDNL
uniref:FBA_2 domain-containing protein n=1 Tax=Caenorhabditis tropicalis TaxID=1561998 RepID=A0A1I7UK21_9PELO